MPNSQNFRVAAFPGPKFKVSLVLHAMMTRRRRRWLASPSLPDNVDVLTEILLRLPPQPSSLPRASLVCKRWHRLVRDLHFVRRFRARHRTPPLLGFFRSTCRFFRTLEPQNRLPASHFALRRWLGRTCSTEWKWWLLDCHHGLVLYGYYGKLGSGIREFVVVNPMTGHRRRVLNAHRGDGVVAAVVLAAAGGGDVVFRHSFRLVVLFSRNFEENVSSSVYSSDSGTWAHLVATLVLPVPSYIIYNPGVVSGNNAVYWLHDDGVIIRFDLGSHGLVVIEQPPVTVVTVLTRQLVTTADDGRFGFAFLSELSIQLWVREEQELGSAANWVLQKTIQLDKVLPLDLKEHGKALGITGFAEERNVIFVCTSDAVYTVNIESMKFKKVYGKPVFQNILPYLSF